MKDAEIFFLVCTFSPSQNEIYSRNRHKCSLKVRKYLIHPINKLKDCWKTWHIQEALMMSFTMSFVHSPEMSIWFLIFLSVNAVNHIYWFVCVEPFWLLRIESQLIVLIFIFSALLDSVCYYLLRSFIAFGQHRYWLVAFLCYVFVCFWYHYGPIKGVGRILSPLYFGVI